MNIHTHRSAGVCVYGFTQARESLKAILDSRERGGLSPVSRPDRLPAAVVNGESLRRYLSLTVVPDVQVENEDGAWTVFMPGRALASETSTLEDGLRDYAEDCEDHLHAVPDHQENWALVQLVEPSTNDQLTAWLTGVAA